jgi:hypothetical protein
MSRKTDTRAPALLILVMIAASALVGPSSAPTVPSAATHLLASEAFAALSETHRGMLLRLAQRPAGSPRARACWLTAPSPQAAALFNAILDGSINSDFQPSQRWTSTSTQGGGLGQGDPTTLTYSFVPDGTVVPDGVGEGPGTSDLFAAFSPFYVSPSIWQNRIHDAFTRWGELTGITYVFEPNDDGAPMFASSGVSGVRGDVRISGKNIDGSGSILAYNYFPGGGGDMVLDTGDSQWFSNSANNYRRLFNVVGHEHGHGIGIAHVCPTDNTKLMEPFINIGFNGPQHDDVLTAQRLYGDRFEHNDTPGTATDLGTLPNGLASVEDLGIDDDGDQDFFKFTVTGTKQLALTLQPVGLQYLEGPQAGSCSSGSPFDSSTLKDLGIEVRDTDGTTVLAAANGNPAGVDEVLAQVPLGSGPGTYYLRVFGDSADTVQLYRLDLGISDAVPMPFSVTFPNGVPAAVDPGSVATVAVQAIPGAAAPDPASGLVYVSVDGTPFVASPLVHLGGNDYEATLPPAPCFSLISWYVSLAPLGGGTPVTGPAGAPTFVTNTTEALTLPLITVFADDFESNQGWTVVDEPGLTDGTWDRGVPVGGGDRGDPAVDADGSGSCFLTDNVDGNSDVDGGATRLLSPVFDLSTYGEARISYEFWYDNDFGNNPGTDVFMIEISDDGGASWVNVETYNASVDAWVSRSLLASQYVALSSQVRMRFTASDPVPTAVVEAGLDAFRIEICSAPLPKLTVPAAAGNVGADVFSINSSSGGGDRRVDAASNQSLSFGMVAPPAAAGLPVPFVLFGRIGVPALSEVTDLGFGIGEMAFAPCLLAPGNASLFVLADSFGGQACNTPLLPSTPTPWIGTVPPLGIPFQVTFQPVILTGPTSVGVANAIILNVQ